MGGHGEEARGRRAGLTRNAWIVGAGDLIGASVFASAVANDQPTIDVMNEIDVDASAVGNHEFDKGWADLRDRVIGPSASRNATWDYLGANVYPKGTTTPGAAGVRDSTPSTTSRSASSAR